MSLDFVEKIDNIEILMSIGEGKTHDFLVLKFPGNFGEVFLGVWLKSTEVALVTRCPHFFDFFLEKVT